MTNATAFFAGLITAVAVYDASAQSLPQFDETDFKIASLQSGSTAVVNSIGRDFYCNLTTEPDSGYIRVDYCIPFVGRDEARQQEEYLAPARAASVAAAASAAAAAEVKKARESADSQKRLDEMQKKIDETSHLNPIEGITYGYVKNEVVVLARTNSCVLTIDDEVLQQVAESYGYSRQLDGTQLKALRELALNAVDELYQERTVGIAGKTIRLWDCK